MNDIVDRIDGATKKPGINEYFKWIIKKHRCNEIVEMVDEAIYDYIDNDWEDEFDTEYDAYQEQGRGEAESQVIMELIGEVEMEFKVKLKSREHIKLGEKIAKKCNIDY